MKNILKNWKTTIGGVALAIATGLFANHKIDAVTFSEVAAVLTALGFIAAKDGNKTGN